MCTKILASKPFDSNCCAKRHSIFLALLIYASIYFHFLLLTQDTRNKTKLSQLPHNTFKIDYFKNLQSMQKFI